MALRNLELQSPDFIQVPLLKKYVVRRVFSNKHVKFRLVAYNPSTCKIRALGEFKLCKARIKGNYSPDSLPQQYEDKVHELKPSTPLDVQRWKPYLAKQTYDITNVKRVERPNQLTFMSMEVPSFDSLPSPFPPSSINTPIDTDIGIKDDPTTSKVTKAEVYL